MFSMDSADSSANTDDNAFLINASQHDLVSIPFANGHAEKELGLKYQGTATHQFFMYNRYNGSEQSSLLDHDISHTPQVNGHSGSGFHGSASISRPNGQLQGSTQGSQNAQHNGLHTPAGYSAQTKINGSNSNSHLVEGVTPFGYGVLSNLQTTKSPTSLPKGAASSRNSTTQSPRVIAHDVKMSSTPELSHSRASSNAPRTADSGLAKTPSMKFQARSSIPMALSWEEFGRQSILAAYSSRLQPFALHPGEYQLLREHITHAQVTIYLNIRNAILRLWTKNPLVSVTLEEAVGCARENRYFNLAKVSYYWLMRNGYINYGCVETANTMGPISRTKSKGGSQRTIVVIGAGMSGLGCARQLEGLFAQLGNQFSNVGERPPKVIVLEGRPRVGGRVYSHQLMFQSQSTLPAGHRCTAEMGAQIVTGYEHGNPLNAIIRGQLAIPYYGLRDNTVIYDHDGSVVEKDQDIMVEKLYNDVLERAAVYRNKPPTFRTVEGERMLMLFGREPSGDGGVLLSALEDSNLPLPVNPIITTALTEEKPSTGVEKLAGRAYQVTSGFNPDISAAEAAKSMGWTMREGCTSERSIDLEQIVKSPDNPTLGQTMDAAIEQYQQMLELTPKDMRLLNWHHANLEYANAVNVNNLNLEGWDQDIGNEFEGEHSEIIGGYQQVPRGLWQCPDKLDVRFETVVKAIRYDVEGSKNSKVVRVECKSGETIEADKLIITTPLGVLKDKSIHFEPALPDWKQGVIDRMGFGLLNKVVLVYEKPFWEEDRDMFGLLNEAEHPTSLQQSDYTSRRGRFYLFWNCIKTSGRPMLVALMAGDAAHYAEASSNESLISEVTGRLAKMFAPKPVPRPVESIVTRWKRDPFSRGSYSYVGPLTQPGDYDVMARSVGPLHFAGEATCGTHPATVHGAYLSGLRAAAEVVESMIGPISMSTPLIPEKKSKTERVLTPASTPASIPAKRPLEDITLQQARADPAALDEEYEAAIITAILTEIGERPIRPGRGTVNPFLLYTKDYWYICKAECDKARKAATGDPEAKASKQEIRIALGAMWRNASEDVKKPYLDQTNNARAESAVNSADFKERVEAWDREAKRIREEYIRNNPPPNNAGQGFAGRTAIEYGGGRRVRRRS